jgi:hypothetical protein
METKRIEIERKEKRKDQKKKRKFSAHVCVYKRRDNIGEL